MDFQFLHDTFNNQWVVLSPRRAERPDELNGFTRPCPFCPESSPVKAGGGLQVLVVKNKYPFAAIHEIIIHSPDHKKNFDTLPLGQTELVFKTYQERYNLHKEQGNVIIFHNFGKDAGASVIHPHSQIVVVPKHVNLNVPIVPLVSHSERSEAPLRSSKYSWSESHSINIGSFLLFCPQTSQWPDEVWILPHSPSSGRASQTFGDISKENLRELSHILARVIQLLDMRHGSDFSFNFYIAPWKNWYLRIIPRLKKPGGFELATGIYVNTQDPLETIAFLKEHFSSPQGQEEKISIHEKYKAKYHRGV